MFQAAREPSFPSCTVCRTDLQARENWGCDAPLEVPLMDVECVRCQGDGCERCAGRGHVEIDRCPWSIVSHADRVAVQVCLVFLEYGTLPFAGGLLDQPGAFWDAWHVVARVRDADRAKDVPK